MIGESLPLLPITPQYEHCPTQRIVLVCMQERRVLERDITALFPNNLARWVFGPGTRNQWPEGDYYVGTDYVERAFQDYHEFARGPTKEEFFCIDPDVLMGEGL